MRTRPLQPLAFEPQPAIVEPGGGSADTKVISVAPVWGPTTTPVPGGGVRVGVGVGVGTTVGVPSPQPGEKTATRHRANTSRDGRMRRSSPDGTPVRLRILRDRADGSRSG